VVDHEGVHVFTSDSRSGTDAAIEQDREAALHRGAVGRDPGGKRVGATDTRPSHHLAAEPRLGARNRIVDGHVVQLVDEPRLLVETRVVRRDNHAPSAEHHRPLLLLEEGDERIV